jgi:peptide-methionine (S)-S-oxide reductase
MRNVIIIACCIPFFSYCGHSEKGAAKQSDNNHDTIELTTVDTATANELKATEQKKLKKATFAAGCFWCEEKVFESVNGVKDVISGYSGGKKQNPTYEEVGTGTTGHAEAFEFEYDPAVISYKNLLKVFFASQDPTQVNGQGPDHGNQYRSIIFYRDEEEKKIAQDYIRELNKSGKYTKPIATEVTAYSVFWKAEAYHQDYIKQHPDNPYVQHESIPRFERTKSSVGEFFKKN